MGIETNNKVVLLHTRDIDFTGLIGGARTEADLFSVCTRLANFFGFPYFLIMKLPTNNSQTLTNLQMISNWPNFLIKEYDRNGLLENSKLINHLKQSTQPYVYDAGKFNISQMSDKEFLTMSVFQLHGIDNGIFFSVHLADGTLGAVSFSGDKNTIDTEHLRELNYLSSLLFSRACSIGMQDDAVQYDLQQREIDCLSWMSRGKSIREIGEILELSEHSISYYMSNAVRKLDAENAHHAIGKALREKLID